MKERPILFSGPMVQAILNGTKTQTRRVVKPQPTQLGFGRNCIVDAYCKPAPFPLAYYERHGAYWNSSAPLKMPYGKPGERLWVRETWAPGDWMVFGTAKEDPETVLYKADKSALHWDGRAMALPLDTYAFNWQAVRWRPSIHMPRWASRITLEITAVRVERLQDISRGDCMAEGCPFPNLAGKTDPVAWYRELWESINGPHSWDDNPWVWVVEFKRVEGGAA